MKNKHIAMLLASVVFAILFSCQNNDYLPTEKPPVDIPTTDPVPPVADTTEVADTVEAEPILILFDTIVSSGTHRIVFDNAFRYWCNARPAYLEDGTIIFLDLEKPENNILRPEDKEESCYFNIYGHWSSFHVFSDWPASSLEQTIIKLKENTTSKTRVIMVRLHGYVDETATIRQLPSQNPEPLQ